MPKVRVYELAKELGVESKIVLTMLKDMGEFVRSASSTVEAPVERRLKEKLASEPPPAKKTARKAPEPTVRRTGCDAGSGGPTTQAGRPWSPLGGSGSAGRRPGLRPRPRRPCHPRRPRSLRLLW